MHIKQVIINKSEDIRSHLDELKPKEFDYYHLEDTHLMMTLFELDPADYEVIRKSNINDTCTEISLQNYEVLFKIITKTLAWTKEKYNHHITWLTSAMKHHKLFSLHDYDAIKEHSNIGYDLYAIGKIILGDYSSKTHFHDFITSSNFITITQMKKYAEQGGIGLAIIDLHI